MGTSVAAQESYLWKQIDDAECYLVSGSFNKAVLTALSIGDQIRESTSQKVCDDNELLELLELAGMVLVQALKELNRIPEMFIQLKTMYGSVKSIHVKVFLTGATMLIAEGSGPDLGPIFEEYLDKWRYTEDQVYVLNGGHDSCSDFIVMSTMVSEDYLEVAELYAVTYLSITSRETEKAISWAEKAELAEPERQDILKKLHELQSASNKNPSTTTAAKQLVEKNMFASMNDSTPPPHEDALTSTAPAHNIAKSHGLKKGLPKSIEPSFQRVTNQFNLQFWWFHSVRVKFGKVHILVPSGKVMLLFSLLFSTIYILRRKGVGLKRAIFQQASSFRRAFLDALQLAFSVQMNPLAAVQQTPQAPRSSW